MTDLLSSMSKSRGFSVPVASPSQMIKHITLSWIAFQGGGGFLHANFFGLAAIVEIVASFYCSNKK